MINCILCAIDFLNFPVKVLEHALEKAHHLNVPLKIIYSYRLTDYEKADDVRNAKFAFELEAREHFEKLEKKVLQNRNISYRFFLEVGFLSDRIEAHIRMNPKAMLIISHPLAESLNELTNQSFFKKLGIPVEYVSYVNSVTKN